VFLLCGWATGVAPLALAADGGFSGGVTPSRFELDSSAGKHLRRSLKIYNLSARPQQYSVRTVEWDYSADGQVGFSNALAADSCREWVRLERHRINVVPDPQQPRNFRFEIQVPENEPARECRFAIMIESLASTYDAVFSAGALTMPITGRIAVIVYLNIGDVEADLQLGELAVREHNDSRLPAIEVRNVGSAHGRLDADLTARNADGERVQLSIATSPILPGQTRYLPLTPEAGKQVHYPITVTGKIYSDGNAFEIDQQL
jgi:hypothetical protein